MCFRERACEPDKPVRAQPPHYRLTLPLADAVVQVHECYLALARSVMQFEKATFAAWRDTADAVAIAHLKAPILVKDADSGEPLGRLAHALPPGSVWASATSRARKIVVKCPRRWRHGLGLLELIQAWRNRLPPIPLL